MISRRTYAFSALALAAILFVGVNIFADNFFTNARLDLTQNRPVHPEPGHPQHPRQAAGAGDAEILLFARPPARAMPRPPPMPSGCAICWANMSALGHGKLILQEVDPEPFTPEEDQASAAGLTPAPTDRGDVVYFGLVRLQQHRRPSDHSPISPPRAKPIWNTTSPR